MKIPIAEICGSEHIWFFGRKNEVCLCGKMYLHGGDLPNAMRLPVPRSMAPNAAQRFGVMTPFIEDE